MKNSLLIICISSIVILFSIDLNAQTNSNLVIVQLYDTPKGNSRSAFLITLTPDSKQETIPLKGLRASPSEAANNYLLFKGEIEKWLIQGYKLISITSEVWQTMPRTSAYLIKEID